MLERVRPGTAGALPLGMAFAAGWTPCIGPVLAGILAIAATGGTVKGAALLVVYSLGLGVPFLLVGLGADWLMRSLGWVRRQLPGDRGGLGSDARGGRRPADHGDRSSGSSPRSRASRPGCRAGSGHGWTGAGGAPSIGAPMTTSSGLTLRQSVAMVWRTLRSMRTALILLLMLAAAAVIGSLLPQIPNSPERVGRYLDDHGFWGTLFFRAGLLRRLRLVVVRADHGAAVRLAGRVSVPADPRHAPRDPAAADPREGAGRVPPSRGGSGRHRTRRGRGDRRPLPAAEAVPRLAGGPRASPPRRECCARSGASCSTGRSSCSSSA